MTSKDNEQKNIRNARKLVSDLERRQHPEYGLTKIKGIELSHSDCDIIRIYAEKIIRNGRFPYDLMEVRGNIRDLFKKYHLPVRPEY